MRDVTEGVKTNIPAKAWKRTNMPRRILAIRLQAMGDLVACLPYLQDLRRSIPENTQLDLLTTEETSSIPRQIDLFNRVYAIGGGRNFKKQVMHGALLLPSLLRNRYEVVLDLQNNSLSRFVRRSLLPRAWTAFDRYSPIAGGERYRLTIEAVGLGANKADYHFRLKAHDNAKEILKQNGWKQDDELVVLNPAAAFETRNWSLPNFVSFAALWKKEYPKARFLVLGTAFIEKKAAWLKEQLGDQLINLTGKTTAFEAFAILQQVKMVLSEDSGLMHMAWCSGVPMPLSAMWSA